MDKIQNHINNGNRRNNQIILSATSLTLLNLCKTNKCELIECIETF